MKSSISCASSISSGPVANQMGRSNSNAFIVSLLRPLQSEHVRHVLIRRRFFLVSTFPFLQVPNFKPAPSAHERDLAFQAKLFAKIFGQDEPALAIGGAMFRAGMELAQKNPAIARGDRAVRFSLGAHPAELLRRHDDEILMMRLGKNDELLAVGLAPAGRDGDAVLLVDGMTELAGE